MKFGNPISDVNATITGGAVSITGTPTVNAGGSGNLGVTSIVSGNIPASNTASLPNGSTTGTFQLLPNSTGTTQYVLVGIQLLLSGNSTTLTIQETGTASDVLISLQNDAVGNVINAYFPLQDITLPVGAGVSLSFANSGKRAANLYYAELTSTTPISGNIIQGGHI